MRQGKLVGLAETRQMTERQLAAMMVGREVVHAPFPKEGKSGEPLVSVENLEVRDHRGLPAVRGCLLSGARSRGLGHCRCGGNGQSELLEAITGMRPIAAGEVQVQGRSVKGLTPVRSAAWAWPMCLRTGWPPVFPARRISRKI